MSDPITFLSATPNIGLPLLLVGQIQKEFFINQALGILDALHGRTALASRSAPPPMPAEGDCYRVKAPATEAWEGYENHIAVHIGGDWQFVAPQEGMGLFDIEAGHALIFRSGWQRADAPAAPTGGAVIDSEARASINNLIQALKAIGTLA